jgi:flagellar biosynthesis/type III secretory pathway M-ring protein FliF/YscJ
MTCLRYRMASLNPSIARLQNEWARTSRPAKIAVAATVAIVLILAACGLTWSGATQYEALFCGRTFSQPELMAIETALGRAGIGDYRIVDGSILVPSERRADCVGAIVDGDALPLGFDLDLKEALNKSSPFESSAQRKDRVQLAKQREISKLLRSMDEIEDASVQFDEEQMGGLRGERRVRAMVVVRLSASAELDPNRIRSIRQLVVASKAFLQPENVTITDLKTGVSYVGSRDLNPALVESDEYALRKSTHERKWTNKIRQVLAFLPGVKVATNVELGYRGSSDVEIKEDYGTVHPSSVTVSVGIPHSYYQRVRQTRGPNLPRATPNAASIQRIEAETIEKVRQLVSGLLPTNLAPDAVRVSVATFTDLQVQPTNTMTERWVKTALGNPLTVCCVVGMCTLGALIAFGIWQDIQDHRLESQQTAARSAGEEGVTVQEIPIQGESSGPSVNLTLDRGLTTKCSEHQDGAIHKELTQLVREDPDAAAEMLGEWVRKAS